jgi:hypothetical protein
VVEKGEKEKGTKGERKEIKTETYSKLKWREKGLTLTNM